MGKAHGTINGVQHWQWRAIDANGDVFDVLIQPRRNAKAVKCFFARLVAAYDDLLVVITDKLRSYTKPIRLCCIFICGLACLGWFSVLGSSYERFQREAFFW